MSRLLQGGLEWTRLHRGDERYKVIQERTGATGSEEGWRVKVYLVRTLTDKRSQSSGFLSTRRSMYLTLGQAHTVPEALETARRWRASRFPPLRVWVEEKGKIAHAERRKKAR